MLLISASKNHLPWRVCEHRSKQCSVLGCSWCYTKGTLVLPWKFQLIWCFRHLILPFIEVQCIDLIRYPHILEPICTYISQGQSDPRRLRWLVEDPVGLLSLDGQKCRVILLPAYHIFDFPLFDSFPNTKLSSCAGRELFDFLRLGEQRNCKRVSSHQRGTLHNFRILFRYFCIWSDEWFDGWK